MLMVLKANFCDCAEKRKGESEWKLIVYQGIYKLNTDPFCLNPNPRFCYIHKSYRKVKAYMLFAFQREEGVLLLTGDPGTGKTTVIKEQLSEWSMAAVNAVTLVTTQLEADDLLRLTAYSFGLDVAQMDKASIIHQFHRYLVIQHRQKRRSLLIVDEAQDLSQSALEELRLLSNLEISNHPLLQIFLVGQRQLLDTLGRPVLEQLRQRLSVAATLEALNIDDVKPYIEHRLNVAGWNDDPHIDIEVYPIIHRYSGGIPRRINQICSRLFLYGFVNNKHTLTPEDANTAIQELIGENLSLNPVAVKSGPHPVCH